MEEKKKEEDDLANQKLEAEKKKQQEKEANVAAAKKKQEEDAVRKMEEQKKAESAPVKANPFGAVLVPPKRPSQQARESEANKAKDIQKPVNMFLLKIQQEKELKLKI